MYVGTYTEEKESLDTPQPSSRIWPAMRTSCYYVFSKGFLLYSEKKKKACGFETRYVNYIDIFYSIYITFYTYLALHIWVYTTYYNVFYVHVVRSNFIAMRPFALKLYSIILRSQS
jgi:hypothetical protein